MHPVGASELAGVRMGRWMSQRFLDRALGSDSIQLIRIVHATLFAKQLCVVPMSSGRVFVVFAHDLSSVLPLIVELSTVINWASDEVRYGCQFLLVITCLVVERARIALQSAIGCHSL